MLPLKALEFIRAHWKLAAAALLLILAFFAGRLSVPDKPAEVKTVVQTKVEYQDRIVEKVVTVEAEAKTKVVYRDRTVTSDGTQHEVTVEKTESDKQTKTDDVKDQHIEAKQVEQKQVVTLAAKSQWRVSALAGLDVHRVSLLPPSPGPLVYGAQVEHRIVGRLSIGVWGLTSGTFGLSASFEF